MNIQFQNIEIYNFLSFEKAEISLNNRNYVLVKGVNENIEDLAKSNGAGKSTIFEAISWCITGETIRGCKDVSNINTNGGVKVKLDFFINGTLYSIIRSKEHSGVKANLKFYVNGEDKSGKGIRDTEKILKEYLPDLTSSLLGSVIILGQGLPMRFTNNSPSGRKEVLEKLSKSDFMIEDLKSRITNRKIELNTFIKECELSIALITGKIESKTSEKSNIFTKLEDAKQKNDFDVQISTHREEIAQLEKTLASLIQSLDDKKEQSINIKNDLTNINTAKIIKCAEETDELLDQVNQLSLSVKTQETDLKHFKQELVKLKDIKDICPTCKQKIQGVEKPDTSALQNLVTETEEKIRIKRGKISELNQAISEKKREIEQKYKEEEKEKEEALTSLNKEIEVLYTTSKTFKDQLSVRTLLISQLETEKLHEKLKLLSILID